MAMEITATIQIAARKPRFTEPLPFKSITDQSSNLIVSGHRSTTVAEAALFPNVYPT
jgi:hypothetical protein